MRMWLFVGAFLLADSVSGSLLSRSYYLCASLRHDNSPLCILFLSLSIVDYTHTHTCMCACRVYICLSFSHALAWTGSCNECFCRQTRRVASWPTMTLLWKYHGRLSRSLACVHRVTLRGNVGEGNGKKSICICTYTTYIVHACNCNVPGIVRAQGVTVCYPNLVSHYNYYTYFSIILFFLFNSESHEFAILFTTCNYFLLRTKMIMFCLINISIASWRNYIKGKIKSGFFINNNHILSL